MVQSPAQAAQLFKKTNIGFVCVTVAAAEGSTPREQGAFMLVTPDSVLGTIGGGRLEWDAIDAARAMLSAGESRRELLVHLGPSIGQCCGGRVALTLETLSDERIEAMLRDEAQQAGARPHVLIYGAGHVGRALALALAPLPFHVTLADSRDAELQRTQAAGVTLLRTDLPMALAQTAPDDAAHVVMTHSHALDSLIAAAVMERGRFRYLGIIGSRTKRNSFRRAFRELGLPAESIARVVCPIGRSDVKDKRPEIIAALAAAEIVEALLGGR
jgi:xanthine dehydrogenase accessory factor